MAHPRVVNVRQKGAYWNVYVGRGRCPRTGEAGVWGNPFTVEEHGTTGPGNALLRYVDAIAHDAMFLAEVRAQLPGLRLGCWCAPGLCHGDVLARLADGEALSAIRARVERETAPPATPPTQGTLFA